MINNHESVFDSILLDLTKATDYLGIR